MSELLPCPFCGSNDVRIADVCSITFIGNCMNCGTSCGCKDTEEEAIAAWNTRYEPMMDAIPMTEENMRKHGWVKERTCNLTENGDLLHCSYCGAAAQGQSWAYWHYCPNCGAKVVG